MADVPLPIIDPVTDLEMDLLNQLAAGNRWQSLEPLSFEVDAEPRAVLSSLGQLRRRELVTDRAGAGVKSYALTTLGEAVLRKLAETRR